MSNRIRSVSELLLLGRQRPKEDSWQIRIKATATIGKLAAISPAASEIVKGSQAGATIGIATAIGISKGIDRRRATVTPQVDSGTATRAAAVRTSRIGCSVWGDRAGRPPQEFARDGPHRVP